MTSTGHRVVDPRIAIRRGSHELAACGVEGDIQDLIIVPTQRVDRCAAAKIPQTRRAVNACRHTEIGGEVELAGGDLPLMAHEGVYAAPRAHIPHLHRVVEGTCQQRVRESTDSCSEGVQVARRKLAAPGRAENTLREYRCSQLSSVTVHFHHLEQKHSAAPHHRTTSQACHMVV